jgi:hypothetical protein
MGRISTRAFPSSLGVWSQRLRNASYDINRNSSWLKSISDCINNFLFWPKIKCKKNYFFAK